MIIQKMLFHILAILKCLYFKMLYGNRFQTNGKFSFRKGFSLIIEYQGTVRIGNGCFFNNYCTVASQNSIQIGDGTLFGENVKIYDHNHCYQDVNIPIKDQGYTSAPIIIGKHCWIASNVTILKGVTIGDNCVIGAGCTIYKDIPNNAIVVNKQELMIK